MATVPSDDVKRRAIQLQAGQSRRLVLFIFLGFILAVLLSLKLGADVVVNDPSETSWLWQAVKMFAWSLIPWTVLLVFAWFSVFRRTSGAEAVFEKNAEAMALMNSGHREEAGKILQTLVRGPRVLAAEVSLNRARLSIEQQRMVDAQVILEKLLEQKSPSAEFTVSLLAVTAEYPRVAGRTGERRAVSFDHAVELCSNPARKGALVYAETLLRLRRGAAKLVAEMPDEEWFSAEGALLRRRRSNA